MGLGARESDDVDPRGLDHATSPPFALGELRHVPGHVTCRQGRRAGMPLTRSGDCFRSRSRRREDSLDVHNRRADAAPQRSFRTPSQYRRRTIRHAAMAERLLGRVARTSRRRPAAALPAMPARTPRRLASGRNLAAGGDLTDHGRTTHSENPHTTLPSPPSSGGLCSDALL
jgi:hypothetical protein